MSDTPPLPSEETFQRTGDAMVEALRMVQSNPTMVAMLVQKAKTMQTAMTVEGTWEDPDNGMRITRHESGCIDIHIPADFLERARASALGLM